MDNKIEKDIEKEVEKFKFLREEISKMKEKKVSDLSYMADVMFNNIKNDEMLNYSIDSLIDVMLETGYDKYTKEQYRTVCKYNNIR